MGNSNFDFDFDYDYDFENSFSKLLIKNEGDIKFYSFDSKKYSNGGKALKKSMPVFYNPIQEINRSVSQIVYKTFQEIISKKEYFKPPFTICDSMAASGIRTLRLLKYLKNPKLIIVNDLNPLALKIIRKNMELNLLTEKNVIYKNNDAVFLFVNLKDSRIYPDCIDIDPFGTPNIFIESALKAVKLGGIIGITATDTTVLFGVKPSACRRKYNVRSLRSTFLKEVGLRILIYYTAIQAHPTMNYIEPIMSLSFDHYVRIFVRLFKGKKGINKNIKNSGYIFWCRKCDWRKTTNLDLRGEVFICPECGSKLDYGGPMWIGPLHNSEFVENCKITLDNSTKDQIPSKKRISKILDVITKEDNFPPGFFNLHHLCDMLQISVSKNQTYIEEIEKLGYSAGLTHIEPRAIKSNIPIKRLKEILKRFHQE